jgi:hypothetical protein
MQGCFDAVKKKYGENAAKAVCREDCAEIFGEGERTGFVG